MKMEFFICGGELKISKKIFIKEMLRPESPMKQLLNYNLEDSGKSRSIEIDKSNPDTVILSFNRVDRVAVGEDYQEILSELKKEYKGNIRGSVSLSGFYYNHMYLNLDLNSDNDKIELIFD